MASLFDQLQATLREQTTEVAKEAFIPYEISKEGLVKWITQVEGECLRAAHDGRTSIELRFYNIGCPRLLPKFGRVLADYEDPKDYTSSFCNGKQWYIEYDFCPEGYYRWLTMMIHRKENSLFNDTAKKVFERMIGLHVKEIIGLLVESWHKKNPRTEAFAGPELIIFDWKEERVAKKHKPDSA